MIIDNSERRLAAMHEHHAISSPVGKEESQDELAAHFSQPRSH